MKSCFIFSVTTLSLHSKRYIVHDKRECSLDVVASILYLLGHFPCRYATRSISALEEHHESGLLSSDSQHQMFTCDRKSVSLRFKA